MERNYFTVTHCYRFVIVITARGQSSRNARRCANEAVASDCDHASNERRDDVRGCSVQLKYPLLDVIAALASMPFRARNPTHYTQAHQSPEPFLSIPGDIATGFVCN